MAYFLPNHKHETCLKEELHGNRYDDEYFHVVSKFQDFRYRLSHYKFMSLFLICKMKSKLGKILQHIMQPKKFILLLKNGQTIA